MFTHQYYYLMFVTHDPKIMRTYTHGIYLENHLVARYFIVRNTTLESIPKLQYMQQIKNSYHFPSNSGVWQH